MAAKPSAKLVMERARKQLALARLGQRDITGSDPQRRVPGIHNAVVFGRSVLYVLENLKSVRRKQFAAWYAPRDLEIKSDPLLSWFLELRNRMLKEGGPEHRVSTSISSLSSFDMARLMKDSPAGAKGFVIGDRLGGSGWEIELPDGSTEIYYVALPPDIAARVSVSLHLPDPPDSHLGRALPGTSIDVLVRLYLDYVERLLSDAEREFAGL